MRVIFMPRFYFGGKVAEMEHRCSGDLNPHYTGPRHRAPDSLGRQAGGLVRMGGLTVAEFVRIRRAHVCPAAAEV